MVIHIEITWDKLLFWGKILLSLCIVAAVIIFSVRCSKLVPPKAPDTVVEKSKNVPLEDKPMLTKEEYEKTQAEYEKILKESEAKAEKARQEERAKRRMLDEIPWQHKGPSPKGASKVIDDPPKKKHKKKKKKHPEKKPDPGVEMQLPDDKDRRKFQNGH